MLIDPLELSSDHRMVIATDNAVSGAHIKLKK